jgi:hypothetical protein
MRAVLTIVALSLCVLVANARLLAVNVISRHGNRAPNPSVRGHEIASSGLTANASCSCSLRAPDAQALSERPRQRSEVH